MELTLTAWITGAIVFFGVMLWTLASVLKNKKILNYSAFFLIAFMGMAYYGVNEIAGIPKYSQLPDKFGLIWFQLNPPDDIYLWIMTEDGIPMTYHVPYTDQLADQLSEAAKKMAMHVQIMGTTDGIEGDSQSEGTVIEFTEAPVGPSKEE